MDGDEKVERELHKRFGKDRLKGEWFSPTKELIDFILTLGEPPDVSRKKPGRYGLWRHMSVAEVERARLAWFDSSYTSDAVAAKAVGLHAATMRLKFGVSGRDGKLTSEQAKAMADQRHKARKDARMPIEQAQVIWRSSRYKRYQDAIAKMPGWTKQAAYDEIGPRTTGAGRPRKI